MKVMPRYWQGLIFSKSSEENACYDKTSVPEPWKGIPVSFLSLSEFMVHGVLGCAHVLGSFKFQDLFYKQ